MSSSPREVLTFQWYARFALSVLSRFLPVSCPLLEALGWKVTLLPKQDDNTEYLCSLGYKVLVKMTHSPLISHLVYAQERIREHQWYTQTCQHMTNNLRTALRMHSQIITAHVSQLVNVRRGVTKGMLFAARCATLFSPLAFAGCVGCIVWNGGPQKEHIQLTWLVGLCTCQSVHVAFFTNNKWNAGAKWWAGWTAWRNKESSCKKSEGHSSINVHCFLKYNFSPPSFFFSLPSPNQPPVRYCVAGRGRDNPPASTSK